MTAKVVDEVRRLCGAGVEVRGATAAFGEPVIASRESFATGARAALDVLEREYRGEHGVLLACFGDPGFEDLKARCPVPVAGMARAALHEAEAWHRPFRIVTAGEAWRSMLRERVAAEDLDILLDDIVVLPTNGLAVSRDPAAVQALVQEEVVRANRDGVTLILGGAGFAGFRARLREADAVIDGLEAAVRELQAR
jgi:allantoin racemase